MSIYSHHKISVIIVNTNTKAVLDICLQNLHDIYPNLEVIVVDTSSLDGSAEMVKQIHPWVKLIVVENNGLAAGLNAGIAQATGEYLLYLGSDAFPEKGHTLEGLVDYFEANPNIGAATVKLLMRDGKIDMDSHRGLPTPWVGFTHFVLLDRMFPKSRLFAEYFKTYEDLNTDHEVGMTITHFMFIKKTVQDKVGKWDETYFLYGEDVDMCYRLFLAGYKLMYLGHLHAQHWKGAIVGRKESKELLTTKGFVRVRGKNMSRKDLYLFVRTCSVDAMRTFYTKHLMHKYPAPLNWWVLTQFVIQKNYRVFYWKFILWYLELKEQFAKK